MTSTEKRIGFGKYKGRSYKEICDNDPSYISWMASKKMSHNIYVEDFRQYCISITQRKFVYILPHTWQILCGDDIFPAYTT